LLTPALLLAGCSLLPSAGPDKADIDHQHGQNPQPPFELIDIGSKIVAAEKLRTGEGFAKHFANSQQPPKVVIGVGDGLTVDIWETGSDTLFSPRAAAVGLAASGGTSARNATLPEQMVDADGSINLPFAGHIAVAGHTPSEVEALIAKALEGKASKPQVLVHVRNNSGTVTVVGDVAAGARIPLSL
jgi:polysaccharide export outer membrane protein